MNTEIPIVKAKSLKDGKWVHGSIVKSVHAHSEKGRMVNKIRYFIVDHLRSTDGHIWAQRMIVIDPKTICRYTTYENLYENDLITIGKDTTIYCVVFDTKHLSWSYVEHSDTLRKLPFNTCDFENGINVIGNYIDTPELWNK